LRENGVVVLECHEPLWTGIDDRVQAARGGWFNVKFIARVIKVYWKLLQKYRKAGDYDVMIVGYPGQFDVFLAWLLTRLRRRPLAWDILMSLYLVIVERNLHRSSMLTARLIHLVERIGFRLPELLVIEGEEYVDWLCKEYALDPKKFGKVPLCTNEKQFALLPDKSEPARFMVTYFGSFIRNHGVDVMVGAAEVLCNEKGIFFEFIGTGPEREGNYQRVKDKNLKNVTFSGFLNDDQFIDHVAKANVCFGTFGNTTHSMVTVQNKIYESMVMGKPLLTGDSVALRRVFEPGTHLFACERSPEAIAKNILFLRDHPDLLKSIALQGHEFVIQNYSLKPLGGRFKALLYPLARKKIQREDSH
jgi:glycosyltransferase involved in cell wall biosynthesis